jgi:hypothetical protein
MAHPEALNDTPDQSAPVSRRTETGRRSATGAGRPAVKKRAGCAPGTVTADPGYGAAKVDRR